LEYARQPQSGLHFSGPMSFFAHRYWTNAEKGSMVGAQNRACHLRINLGRKLYGFNLESWDLLNWFQVIPPDTDIDADDFVS
jgi:hypothetical protein